MEVTIFESIMRAISQFGIVNTLTGVAITVVLAYLYRNKVKSTKTLTDTVQTNNDNILLAISNQTNLLTEVERTSNSVLVAIKEVGAKVDGFMSLVVGLVQRDVDRGGE